MIKSRVVLASLSLAMAAPRLLAAEDLSSLGATNAYSSQRYLGTGKGVLISILDSGIDAKHPSLAGAVSSQQDFTGEKTLDDLIKQPGHGTGIAGILVGRGKQYTGLAPGAKVINARVDNSDDVSSDLWAGNGLIWSAKKGARVANISFGNKLGTPQLTERFTLMCDYVAERYGVNVVVAGGNDGNQDGSAVKQVPAGLFNGYTVGALDGPDYARVAGFSNWAQDDDRRSKPDLVAPGVNVMAPAANWERKGKSDYIPMTGTSFSAPLVGGVLAQMIGYGKEHDLPTDPLLLKAVLMTSAAKSRDTDGSAWEARAGERNKYYGYVFNRPLDDEQGAGALDAVAAYRLYARVKARSTPLNTWKEGKLKGNQTYDLALGKLYEGQRLDATLTWMHHVAVKDRGSKGLDAKDTFYETAGLADFTLALLRDGVPIAASDSNVDNLEHLSWTLEKTANYTLQVYRFEEGGLATENFALAARVLKGESAGVMQSLSFDGSQAAAFAATPVPEPGVVALGLTCMALASSTRRRRR
jgi:subtilisin family serine protease